MRQCRALAVDRKPEAVEQSWREGRTSGAVTDFIDVYVGTHHWPSFNVADSAITVGAGIMIVDMLGIGSHVSKTG